MGSLFSGQPKPPSVASQEAAHRRSADATIGRELQYNRPNQFGPFGGSITYDPETGAQTTALGQQGQQYAGGLANLGERYFGMAGQGVPDSSAAFDQAYGYASANLEPRFERSRAAAESRLRNQGLDPTSAAYKSAMNDLALQQNEARNNLVTGLQGQMFNQGLAGRQQTLAELSPGLQYGIPAFMDPNVSPLQRIDTGGTFNAPGAMQANYQQELDNYNNQQMGAFGLARTGLGLLTAPMTGGLSLAGMGMNLMQGNPYNYGSSWAPSVRYG
jgi:hypothetical protein